MYKFFIVDKTMGKMIFKKTSRSFPEWWYRKVMDYLGDDFADENDLVIWEEKVFFYSYNWLLREKKYLKKLFILGYNPEGVIDLYKQVKPLIDKEVFPEISYCTMRDLYMYALEQRRK